MQRLWGAEARGGEKLAIAELDKVELTAVE